MENTDNKKSPYVEVPTNILESLVFAELSRTQMSVFLYIVRKLYGWHKQADAISISKTAKELNRDYRYIRRAFHDLKAKGMISADFSKGRVPKISINPPDHWAIPMEKTTQVSNVRKITQVTNGKNHIGNVRKITQEPVEKITHTKEKKETYKENIKENTPYIPHEEKVRFVDVPFSQAYTEEELKKLAEEGWE